MVGSRGSNAASESGKVVSIQTERRKANPASPGVKCKAQWRHGNLNGNVWQTTINGVVYWLAVLACDCGTVRTTRYVPHTWEKVGSHKYWRADDSDYPDDMTHEECRVAYLNSILILE
jgi:hypothetical protein